MDHISEDLVFGRSTGQSTFWRRYQTDTGSLYCGVIKSPMLPVTGGGKGARARVSTARMRPGRCGEAPRAAPLPPRYGVPGPAGSPPACRAGSGRCARRRAGGGGGEGCGGGGRITWSGDSLMCGCERSRREDNGERGFQGGRTGLVGLGSTTPLLSSSPPLLPLRSSSRLLMILSMDPPLSLAPSCLHL